MNNSKEEQQFMAYMAFTKSLIEGRPDLKADQVKVAAKELVDFGTEQYLKDYKPTPVSASNGFKAKKPYTPETCPECGETYNSQNGKYQRCFNCGKKQAPF